MQPGALGDAIRMGSSRGQEPIMKAIADLFSTDYGLFSIAGIAFMIGMAVWFYRFFNRKMAESEQAERSKV